MLRVEYTAGDVLCINGVFHDGVDTGKGAEYVNDRCLYVGEWVGGKWNGVGRDFFAEKRPTLQYYGEFRDGKWSGTGCIVLDGTNVLFDGQYEDGHRVRGAMYRHSVRDNKPFEWSYPCRLSCTGLVMGAKQYQGGFAQSQEHGFGTHFSADGTVVLQGVFEHGKRRDAMTQKAWEREQARIAKRGVREKKQRAAARQRVVALHAANRYLSEIPQCALCFEELHPGDLSWIYIPCGHRCICDDCTVPPAWKTRCILCKAKDASLFKCY